MSSALRDVLRHPAIWQGNAGGMTAGDVLASGFATLDAVLPGGGWPRTAVTELLVTRPGSGELALLWPMLARLSRQAALVLVNPPLIPYAPAWQQAGLRLQRLIRVQPPSVAEALWTMEQALRESSCGAVLGWFCGGVDDRAARRLQLAAREGGGCGLLVRAGRMPQAAVDGLPLPLRLAVSPAPQGWQVRVLKRRGLPLTEPVLLSFQEGHHALAGARIAATTAGCLRDGGVSVASRVAR
ncbi:translesion DNA synthesis-associated protein ImuA [Andreprevotia chitinilytica]|uniref:translesion DNA synthesis-associated protein ImuA n=1 Tax=Andreprevotia chitinilytica TaxID=396808 RepID=UPI0005563508|nr:translesion DNA synthesis-associated protein ImuA [Andreprevotia chitinilytica]